MVTRVNTLFTNDTPAEKLCQNFSKVVNIALIWKVAGKPGAARPFVNVVHALPVPRFLRSNMSSAQVSEFTSHSYK